MHEAYRRYNISGGLVFDLQLSMRRKSHFTMFLYLRLSEQEYRRIHIWSNTCEGCGFEGISFASYDAYSTIRENHTTARNLISDSIKNETTTSCEHCRLEYTPIQYRYKTVPKEEYISFLRGS